MNTKILNVLCEGATEELFVKRVLKEHLAVHGIVVKTRLLQTNRRLINELADARCHYEKTKAGVEIVLRVGLSALRERCRHFDMWVRRLEEI